MIGLDTNILLRAALNDDPVQSPKAQALLRSLGEEQNGFVNIPVLTEFFWVLRSRYKLPPARLAAMMRSLIEVEYIQFEALETIGKALAAYERRGPDFADAVISLRNRDLGVDSTLTFDKDAARLVPGMALLP